MKTIEPHRRFPYDGAMNEEHAVSQAQDLKQARLDRLNKPSNTPRVLSDTVAIHAQQKIDRLCSTRFADAVARNVILCSQEELLAFASLPNHLIGKADLAGVHDAATLAAFIKENPQTKEGVC